MRTFTKRTQKNKPGIVSIEKDKEDAAYKVFSSDEMDVFKASMLPELLNCSGRQWKFQGQFVDSQLL